MEQAGTAETVTPVAPPPVSADWSRLVCLSQSPRACFFSGEWGGGGSVEDGGQSRTAETVAPVAPPPLSTDWSRLVCLSLLFSVEDGGPSGLELLRLLDQCDLSASRCSTPCISPSPSLLIGPGVLPLTARLKLGPLQSSMHSNASSSSGPGDAQAEQDAEVIVCV